MTTPNAEFNVLFPGFKGFRHPDHKFEWSRAEFQDWYVGVGECACVLVVESVRLCVSVTSPQLVPCVDPGCVCVCVCVCACCCSASRSVRRQRAFVRDATAFLPVRRCDGVAARFGYAVRYDGVGTPTPGREDVGYCSQIAIFTRCDDAKAQDGDLTQTTTATITNATKAHADAVPDGANATTDSDATNVNKPIIATASCATNASNAVDNGITAGDASVDMETDASRADSEKPVAPSGGSGDGSDLTDTPYRLVRST